MIYSNYLNKVDINFLAANLVIIFNFYLIIYTIY